MAFWHWKEAFCGRDEDAFVRAKRNLEASGIVYKTRLVGSHSLLGIRDKGPVNIQYYIYVKKQDAEYARHLLGL